MRRASFVLVSFVVLLTCVQMAWASRAEGGGDLGSIINGVLQNEAWTRILALGVILWLVLQARSDKKWIVSELQEIKDKMVTTDKLDHSTRELAEEIRTWADNRFLTDRESGLQFGELSRRLDKAGA